MIRFKSRFLAGAALAVLTLGSTAALAHPGLWKQLGPPPAEVVQQYDTNKDGRLDGGEWRALRESFKAQRKQRRQEALSRYDADRSGSLDPAERQKLRQDRAAERFKALDADGNGALTLAEFQAGAGRGGPWHKALK